MPTGKDNTEAKASIAVNAQSVALSAIEQKQLEKSEILIAKNFVNFTKAGFELLTIRDQKLYREKHKTWADYCKLKWGFSDSYADRLIKAAVFARGKLEPQGISFTCEGELRKLVGLTDEQFKTALEKSREAAEKEHLPLTAAFIAKQLRKKHRTKAGWSLLNILQQIAAFFGGLKM